MSRLDQTINHAIEATSRASQALQTATKKQDELKRRWSALEYRIEFVMGIIQDTKAEWNVE